MGTLAIRRSAWQAASLRDRTVLRVGASHRLRFGTDTKLAIYLNPAAVEHFVMADERINLEFVAAFGTLAAWLNQDATYQLPVGEDGSVNEAQIVDDLKPVIAPLIVHPRDIAFTEGADPFVETLAAQNAPAPLKAWGAIPADWTSPAEEA